MHQTQSDKHTEPQKEYLGGTCSNVHNWGMASLFNRRNQQGNMYDKSSVEYEELVSCKGHYSLFMGSMSYSTFITHVQTEWFSTSLKAVGVLIN